MRAEGEQRFAAITENTYVKLGAVIALFAGMISTVGMLLFLVNRDVGFRKDMHYITTGIIEDVERTSKTIERINTATATNEASIRALNALVVGRTRGGWHRDQHDRWVRDVERAIQADLPDPWDKRYDPDG